MKKTALLLIPLLVSIASGAVRQSGGMNKIKDALAQKARKAEKIAASIQSLEKEIGKVNNQYLERARVNQSLEKKLEKLQAGLDQRISELKLKEEKAKRLMRLYALEAQDDLDENGLLKKTVLTNMLKKNLSELGRLKTSARELGETFKDYRAQLEETRRTEENLYSLIVDLENKKKDLSKNYISSLESKNELEEKLENAMAKRNAYQIARKSALGSGAIKMIPPLERFVNFKGSKKGVTFKYDERAPVKATAGGKVVYSGELASYGKVVMLDHGKEVRSVILGDLQIKVKKGDTVTQGQIIGYTMAEPGLKKSLYYEVRKKNIAQNTLRWLKDHSKLANITKL